MTGQIEKKGRLKKIIRVISEARGLIIGQKTQMDEWPVPKNRHKPVDVRFDLALKEETGRGGLFDEVDIN